MTVGVSRQTQPSSCLVVLVSRKAMEHSDSISFVDLMRGLKELRCEWNSSTCSLFTCLNHHLGGIRVDERAFSSHVP